MAAGIDRALREALLPRRGPEAQDEVAEAAQEADA
jgi:hypothetical protein